MVAKVFNDLLIAGQHTISGPIIESINECFQLGTVVQGPSMLQYYRFNITEWGDVYITVDEPDKRQDLE